MHSLWIKVTIESASGAGVASCFLMWFSSARGSFSPLFFLYKFLPSAKMALPQYKPCTSEGKSAPVTFSGVPRVRGFGCPAPGVCPARAVAVCPQPRAINNPELLHAAISVLDRVQNSSGNNCHGPAQEENAQTVTEHMPPVPGME